MEIRRGFVDANGLRFGFLEAGPRQGPLVLCLHGFPDSAWTWRRLLPVLGDAGFHGVAPFMRGYAPTDAPVDSSYGTPTLGADANALHEVLAGDADSVLVGHDWGAEAAYAAVALAPERWRRLVTAAVPPTGPIAVDLFSYEQMRRSWYSFLLQLPVAEPLVRADGLLFLDRLWADWSPRYEATEDLARAKEALAEPANLAAAIQYYRDSPSALPASPGAEAGDVSEPAAWPPLLYLHGADDGCIGIDVVHAAKPFFPPRAEIVIVADAGHFLHLEKPDEVNGRIVAFTRS